MTMAYKRLKLYSSSRSNLDHPPDSFWRQDSRESQRWLLDDTLDSDDFEFRRQRSWDSVRFAQNKHNAKSRPRFYPPRLAESDESLCKPHANHGGKYTHNFCTFSIINASLFFYIQRSSTFWRTFIIPQ